MLYCFTSIHDVLIAKFPINLIICFKNRNMKNFAINNVRTVFLGFFSLFLTLNLYSQISSYPYIENFESGSGGWTVHGTNTSWALGAPLNSIINSAASGFNGWVTNLNGNNLDNENGWVQSPIFNLSSLTDPHIQFNIWWECESSNDGAVLQSSVDSGNSWQNVGPSGSNTNWYNNSSISGLPGGQQIGWSGSSNGWKTSIHSLTDLIGQTNVIFRVAFASNSSIQNNGVAFDNFQISDITCYAGEDRTLSCIPNGSIINLDELLASNSRNTIESSVLLRSSSWTFISGPIGPRGPRFVYVSGDDDDVDFPNTGSGPAEYYVFKYTVTDGQCEDSALITVCVEGDEAPNYEYDELYICSGETITNADELFNSIYLNVRDLDGGWYDSGFNEITFPVGSGDYTYYDNTGNQLDIFVNDEIECSDHNVQFSFANAQNTSDGTNGFFEVDVMMQTLGENASFKLGDGQLFFRYNTAAFGEYINAYNRIEITSPEGYIVDQSIDSDPNTKIYFSGGALDNTNNDDTNRVSWKFRQNYSSSSFSTDNVDNTPKKLCHLKLQYTDVNEPPILLFEDNDPLSIYDNQFTTATNCGLVFGGDEIINCFPNLRTLIVNDSFENLGATLSDNDINFSQDISLYPNPTKNMLYVKGNINSLSAIKIYSVSGSEIMELNKDFTEIDVSQLESGIYFLKLINKEASKTFKVFKN